MAGKGKTWRKLASQQFGSVYDLTEEEKISIGLIRKPEVLRDLVHIVIPVHYGSHGVIWESQFIDERQLELWQNAYPDLQVVND